MDVTQLVLPWPQKALHGPTGSQVDLSFLFASTCKSVSKIILNYTCLKARAILKEFSNGVTCSVNP